MTHFFFNSQDLVLLILKLLVGRKADGTVFNIWILFLIDQLNISVILKISFMLSSDTAQTPESYISAEKQKRNIA